LVFENTPFYFSLLSIVSPAMDNYFFEENYLPALSISNGFEHFVGQVKQIS
jgi:hypothetical protein